MKSYSPKLIIKLWQKSQALASTNPKISKQIKELLKEVRVFNDNTIKRDHLEILLRGIIKEVVAGMQTRETIAPLGGMEEEGKKDWGVVGPPKRLFNPKVGVYPADFKSVPNYIRIKKSRIPGEFMVAWFVNGKFNEDKTYYTDDLGDAYDTMKAMKPQVDAANGGVAIKEMTTTSGGGGSSAGTPGYNIPRCFSKKGGSEKGVEGSEKLGYTLTSTGKDEMDRRADKLLESMMEELK